MSIIMRDPAGLADFDELFGGNPVPSSYKEHLQSVVDELNNLKSYIGKGIIFSCPDEIRPNNSIDKFDQLETGKLYPNIIKGVGETLWRIKKNKGGKSYCYYLPTNCGKTTYSNAMQFIAPAVISFLTGKKYYPIRLVPNKCSGEEQTEFSYRIFRELYGEIKISFKGKAYSLNEIEARMRLETIDNDESIIRCSVKNRDKIIKRAVAEVYGKDGHILFVSDEPSHGSNNGGVLDTIRSLSKDLYSEQDGDIFIGTDAAPFELFNNSNIELIYGKLYGNYCGLSSINGRDTDPDFPNLPCPTIKNHRAFMREHNFKHDLSIIYPNYYKCVRQFNKHMRDQERRLKKGLPPPNGIFIPPGTTWLQYKRMCEDAIVEFLEYVSTTKGKLGVLIRFVINNRLMNNSFIEAIRKRLEGKMQVLGFFGQKSSFREFLKDSNCNQELPYVVFVTAGCRMGDDCPIFIASSPHTDDHTTRKCKQPKNDWLLCH